MKYCDDVIANFHSFHTFLTLFGLTLAASILKLCWTLDFVRLSF